MLRSQFLFIDFNCGSLYSFVLSLFRRIDVGAVIQLTQDSMHRGRLSAQINEKCEQGRIRRTTIGGRLSPDRPAFFRETRAEFAVAARDQVQTGTASTRMDGVRCQNTRTAAPHSSLASGNTGHLPRGI